MDRSPEAIGFNGGVGMDNCPVFAVFGIEDGAGWDHSCSDQSSETNFGFAVKMVDGYQLFRQGSSLLYSLVGVFDIGLVFFKAYVVAAKAFG